MSSQRICHLNDPECNIGYEISLTSRSEGEVMTAIVFDFLSLKVKFVSSHRFLGLIR